jgi:predicted transcriptional regulator
LAEPVGISVGEINVALDSEISEVDSVEDREIGIDGSELAELVGISVGEISVVLDPEISEVDSGVNSLEDGEIGIDGSELTELVGISVGEINVVLDPIPSALLVVESVSSVLVDDKIVSVLKVLSTGIELADD